MEIDEISLVDRPANPHAVVSIAKRAQEEAVSDDYFARDGSPVDLGGLEFGDVVYDADGSPFQWVPDEADDTADEIQQDDDEREPVEVGKSLGDQVRADLSKAFSEIERDDAISKAADAISKAEERVATAERIAKAERELRLTREYIAKAAEYNVPIAAEELGPVLLRAAESLDEDDCAVLHKALASAGQMLFDEAGYTGQAANEDPMALIEAEINGAIGKSAGEQISKHQAIANFFDTNPAAYDEYVAGLGQ